MKRATVYRRQVSFVVHPSSRTSDGVWILTEPCVRLSSEASDQVLGTAILAAIEASRTLEPSPANWGDVSSPLLVSAGVGTWSAFVKGTTSVELEMHAGVLELLPTRNLGSAKGFEIIHAQKECLDSPIPAEALGAAVRLVMERAR
jgi:hypothetical protein